MSELPKRIQRKRSKGWKMPPNTVYVGRPTIYGNPFLLGIGDSRERVIEMYRDWLSGKSGINGLRRIAALSQIVKLRGKNLACFCPLDKPCHADVLLEIANVPEKRQPVS